MGGKERGNEQLREPFVLYREKEITLHFRTKLWYDCIWSDNFSTKSRPVVFSLLLLLQFAGSAPIHRLCLERCKFSVDAKSMPFHESGVVKVVNPCRKKTKQNKNWANFSHWAHSCSCASSKFFLASFAVVSLRPFLITFQYSGTSPGHFRTMLPLRWTRLFSQKMKNYTLQLANFATFALTECSWRCWCTRSLWRLHQCPQPGIALTCQQPEASHSQTRNSWHYLLMLHKLQK